MTVYLRTYGSMENQPDSKRTADLCNNVVRTCIEELRRQGVDAQLSFFGDKQLINFDSNANKIVPKFKHKVEYISIDGELCLSTKILKEVSCIVPMKKERNFDYMSVDSVLTSYEQNGIVYECNGDFTSIRKTSV